jgi:hypothetical protein
MKPKDFDPYKRILKNHGYDCSPEILLEIVQNIENLADLIKQVEYRKNSKKGRNIANKHYEAD